MPVQSNWPVEEWRRLRAEGMTSQQVADMYGCGKTTVKDWCALGRARRSHTEPSEIQRREEFAAMIRASKPLPRCQCCEIILERSGCVGHDNDSPDAGYCWACRADYPEVCR